MVFLTSSLVAAGSKSKKDHPKKGNQNVADTTGEVEDVEAAPSVKSDDNPVNQLSHSGIIKGMVIIDCDETSSNENDGILVYIPGRSFMAKTGNGGYFELSYVPSGIYDLIIEIPDQEPFVIDGVEVIKKRTTDISTVNFCVDNDGDGFILLEDCDDGNSAVNPGAEEICGDDIDNNCNEEVDEDCSSPAVPPSMPPSNQF